MKPRSTLRHFLFLAGSSLMAISSASAQDGTWIADADGDWGTDTNWSSEIIADGAESQASFNFDITANRVVNLESDRTIGRIFFLDPTSSNNLTISGANILILERANTPIIDVAQGVRTLTISSVIDGTQGMNKIGNGTLVVSDSNIYTGNTVISNGTLRAGKLADYGTNSSIGAAGSGIIRFGDNTATGVLNYVGSGDTSNRIFVIGDNTAGDTRIGGGRINANGGDLLEFTAANFNEVQATATAARLLTLGGASTGKINGVIQNNGDGTVAVSLTKLEGGTWTLDGVNTYTGTTQVDAGTLKLTGNRTAAAGAITVRTGGTLEISNGDFSIGISTFTVGATLGTSTVNHTGGTITTGTPGLQVLIGNNTNGGGIYNLSGGELNIGYNGTFTGGRGIILGVNSDNPGASFNLSGTGHLNMTGANSGLQIGRSDAVANNTTNAFNQTGGTATIGYLGIGGVAGGSTGVNSTLSITDGVFTATVFDRLAYGDSNTAKIHIGGTADVTLPQFASGSLGTGSTATIEFDGGVLKNLAASTNYLGNISSAQIMAGGAKFNTTGGDITITQNLLTHGSSTGGGLTKEGTNTLTLTGSNTYTGPTAINGGTLVITGATQDTSAITFGGGNLGLDIDSPVTAANATVNFTGQSVLVTGSPTLSSYTLLTASSIAPGNPTLAAPAPSGYSLEVVGNKLRLVQTSGSAYGTWAATNAPTTGNDPAADEDGDGVSNALEFVLGGTIGTNDLAKLPVIATSGGNMTFTFQRDQASIDPATALSIEVSTNLATWNTPPSPYVVPDGETAGPPVSVQKNVPSAGTDTITLTLPQSPDAKKFARLKVVITP